MSFYIPATNEPMSLEHRDIELSSRTHVVSNKQAFHTKHPRKESIPASVLLATGSNIKDKEHAGSTTVAEKSPEYGS